MNEVKELHSTTRVALCQADDQAKIGAQEMALCALAVFGNPLQLSLYLLVELGRGSETIFSEETRFDSHGQLDLFGGIEQGNFTDLLEVILDGVCRRARNQRRIDGNVIIIVGG